MQSAAGKWVSKRAAPAPLLCIPEPLDPLFSDPSSKTPSALCGAVSRQKGDSPVAPCSTFGHRARSHSSASAGGNDVPRDGGCPSNFQPASLLLLASRGSACPRTRLRQGWGLRGFLFVCLGFCLGCFFERHGKSAVKKKKTVIIMEMEKSLKPVSCG